VEQLFDTIARNILRTNDRTSRIYNSAASAADSLLALPTEASAALSSSSSLIGTQILVLQNFHHVISTLASLSLFDRSFLVATAVRFLSMLPSDNRKIAEQKLQLCRSLMFTTLFAGEGGEHGLIAGVCRLLVRHLEQSTEPVIIGQCLLTVLELVDQLMSRALNTAGALNVIKDLPELISVYHACNQLYEEIGDGTRFNNRLSAGDLRAFRSELVVAMIAMMDLVRSPEALVSLFCNTGLQSCCVTKMDLFFKVAIHSFRGRYFKLLQLVFIFMTS
jgi:hypothetical protein